MTLFQAALGPDWAKLPPELRAFHGEGGVRRFAGEAEITQGTALLVRLACRAFGFPPPGQAVPISITLTRDGLTERWERDFGGARFRSRLSPGAPGGIWETIRGTSFEMAPRLEGGILHLPVRRGRALGLPLPRALLPRSEAREFARDGRFHFDIRLSLPLFGPMIRYRGWLEPQEDP